MSAVMIDLEKKFTDSYKYLKGRTVARGLSGDVYEISLREKLKEFLSKEKVRVGHGMLYKSASERSNQLDIILYKAKAKALFTAGEDFGIWRPTDALVVIEVKGYIGPADLPAVRSNLLSAKNLSPKIKGYCFVVTPPGKRSFSKFRASAYKAGIDGLFALWDKPGKNGGLITGDGSLDSFLSRLMEDIRDDG